MSDKIPLCRLLLTGGNGTLGREVLEALHERPEIAVRSLSRRAPRASSSSSQGWIQADLLTDDLHASTRDSDVIVHLASSKGSLDADVIASERLLWAAKATGVRHFVVISIIGCEQIPLPFYATKQRIEAAVRASGMPWSIIRVAQFHSFVDRLVATAASSPIPTPFVADLCFQPVDEREVADRLLEIALGPPLSDAPEMAGPEVLTLAQIAEAWLAVRGNAGTLVPVSVAALFGSEPRVSAWAQPVLEGYRRGLNLPRAERTLGRVRFSDWLRRRAVNTK